MKLTNYFQIMLWAITAPHKAKYYYYRVEKCGMIDWIAYEQSKYLTKAQWSKMENEW